MKHRSWFPTVHIPFVLLGIFVEAAAGQQFPRLSLQNQTDSITEEPIGKFTISAGRSWYSMSEFNRKLSVEGNNTVGGGLDVVVELEHSRVFRVPLPVNLNLFPGAGFEYMRARSSTSRADGVGGTVVVTWSLPIVGVFFAPVIQRVDAAPGFYVRPIGVGYYWLGIIDDADLVITDRPGRLKQSGNAVGTLSVVGFSFGYGGAKIGVEGGYRALSFSSVSQTREGLFTETADPNSPLVPEVSRLPEELDYSGFFVRLTLSIS